MCLFLFKSNLTCRMKKLKEFACCLFTAVLFVAQLEELHIVTRPHHVAFGCILDGLDDPQSLLETHLFNHVSTDRVKFLTQREWETE